MKRLAPLVLTLAACAGSPGVGGADGGIDADGSVALVAELEIGVDQGGGEGFAPIAEGSDVTLVSGSQGGFHVWTAPRLVGAEGTLYLDRTARRVVDDRLVLRASRTVLEAPAEAMNDWWHQDRALPSFMCPTPIGVSIIDEPIEFTFELYSEDEVLLGRDTLTVTPRCPEGDDAVFCQDICSGN